VKQKGKSDKRITESRVGQEEALLRAMKGKEQLTGELLKRV
jgi:hypothetical protein